MYINYSIKVKKILFFFLLSVCLPIGAHQADTLGVENKPLNTKRSFWQNPFFITLKYTAGKVLKSDPSLSGDNAIPFARYGELKLGIAATGETWQDIAYGMPYYGIGVGYYDFNRDFMGTPVAIYLLQGGNLHSFSRQTRLKYELNLGCSFNWNAYDPIKNPRNQSIGAKASIYFAANAYLSQMLSRNTELQLGATFNHVSKGATKIPNSGVNTVAGFVGVKYYFNSDQIADDFKSTVTPPKYSDGRLISDVLVHTSVHQRKYPPTKSGLTTEFVDHSFFVMGASYALMYMPNYKFRYGGGIDIIYDESYGYKAHKVGVRKDGYEIANIQYGKVGERFALGLSLRGDIVLSKYVITGQLGYDVIRGGDSPFYQSFSFKVPFLDKLYASFTIRAVNFGKAQYMLLGLGYTFDHRKYKVIF